MPQCPVWSKNSSDGHTITVLLGFSSCSLRCEWLSESRPDGDGHRRPRRKSQVWPVTRRELGSYVPS
jgi:hypothetical protein